VKHYEVYLSPLAEVKLTKLLNFLSEEWSEKIKDNYLTILKSKFTQLSNFPESCELSAKKKGVYKCVVTKQSIFFYRIKGREVEIITLFDSRQDPKKLRKELKKYFG
jgi:plasmid stabilization system protein ParE